MLGTSVLLEANSLDSDESRGISRLEVSNFVHGTLASIVEFLGLGGAAKNHKVAFVNRASDLTVDVLLRRGNHRPDVLALRSEVHTVVKLTRESGGHELVTDSTNLAVKNKALEIDVSGAKNGKTGSLVAAARLQADEAVLDDVDTAYTVATSDGVGGEKKLDGVSDFLAVVIHKLNWNSLFEVDGELLRLIGSILWVDSELPHILWRGGVGVLKNTSLERDVSKVLVGTPWLSGGLLNGNALLSSISEKSRAAGETVEELGKTPRCNAFDIGLQSVEGKLKSNLVITLSSAAMSDGKAAFLLSNLDLSTSDNGTGERSSQEINVFVNGIGLNSREATDILAQQSPKKRFIYNNEAYQSSSINSRRTSTRTYLEAPIFKALARAASKSSSIEIVLER